MIPQNQIGVKHFPRFKVSYVKMRGIVVLQWCHRVYTLFMIYMKRVYRLIYVKGLYVGPELIRYVLDL